jgi:selenoprotein W-related protein
MTDIEIEYCVPCGLLDDAIETQQSLLEEYGRDLDTVCLKPGHGGVFEVRVDDRLVYDKDEREEGYDLESVRSAVDETVSQPA